MSRPIIFHYLAERQRLAEMAGSLFAAIGSGSLTAEAGKARPLAEVAAAHEELESRLAAGPLVLIP